LSPYKKKRSIIHNNHLSAVALHAEYRDILPLVANLCQWCSQ